MSFSEPSPYDDGPVPFENEPFPYNYGEASPPLLGGHDSPGRLLGPSPDEILTKMFGDSDLREQTAKDAASRSETEAKRTKWIVRTLAATTTATVVAGGAIVTCDTISSHAHGSHTAATSSSPAVTTRPSITGDWRNGTAVIHFVELRNTAGHTQPASASVRAQTEAGIRQAINRFHADTQGIFPEMPVTVGTDIDLQDIIETTTAACDSDKQDTLDWSADSQLDDTHNLDILVFDHPDVVCKGNHTAAKAVGQGVVSVYDDSIFTTSSGGGMIEHELNHLGPKPGTPYGHDSALIPNAQQAIDGTSGIDPYDSTAASYGNTTTVPGYGFFQDRPDPDPFTGFELKRLGLLDEKQIKTLAGSGSVTVESIASSTPGEKALRIPVTGLDIPANPVNRLQTEQPTALYIELSDGPLYADRPPQLELKAYLVNETSENPSTYLVALNSHGELYGLTQENIGQSRTILLGEKKVAITLNTLQQATSGQGSATLDVIAEKNK